MTASAPSPSAQRPRKISGQVAIQHDHFRAERDQVRRALPLAATGERDIPPLLQESCANRSADLAGSAEDERAPDQNPTPYGSKKAIKPTAPASVAKLLPDAATGWRTSIADIPA